MRQPHPAFPQPADANVPLWRYMDFTRFVAMLAYGGLFFPRSHLMTDTFEGTYPLANVEYDPVELALLFAGSLSDEQKALLRSARKDFLTLARLLRKWTMISCWHMSQYESEALWKVYSIAPQQVALRTTYATLAAALPEDILIGTVTYLDYRTEGIWTGTTTAFGPFMHKRQSFAYEREVRAIKRAALAGRTTLWSPDEKPPDNGEWVPVNLNQLIHAIYTSPACGQWYRELVERVARTYGVNAPVCPSSLDDEPFH